MSKTLYAAVIGVDRYPGLSSRYQLSGCVNDALAIRAFLIDHAAIPEGNIRLHLAPRNDDTVAHLAPGTRLSANAQDIRASFDILRSVAKPGIHIVLYYAGHGVRIDRRGTNERIYGFAPSDLSIDAAGFTNLVLDCELNKALRDLTESGAEVTVLADTCHAGGSTRAVAGMEATVRRILVPALSDEEWMQIVRNHPALSRQEPERSGTTTANRGAISAGWFDGSNESREWVVLAACLDRETAKEDELDGVPHGLFTACLLRELRNVPPKATTGLRWLDFFADVRRAVMSRASGLRHGDQTPVLEGRPEKTVFGGEWTPFEPGFTVRPGTSMNEVQVDAGLIDGLDEDAEIGIYPPKTASFREADAAGIQHVRAQILAPVLPGKCTARLLDKGVTVADKSRARLVKPSPNHPKMGVRLTDMPSSIVSALEKAEDLGEFVVLNPTEGSIDVEVRPWNKPIPAWDDDIDASKVPWIGTTGGWVIVPYAPEDTEPMEDDVIAYVPRLDAPGVDDGAWGVGVALAQGLVQWARYLRVLRVSHVDAGLASLIKVALYKGPAVKSLELLYPSPSGEYLLQEEEPLWVELRADKQLTSRVSVAFVACSNDGNTMLQWPSEGAAPTLTEIDDGEGLGEGQTIRVGEDRFHPAKPTVRTDQSSSVYTFKVIAAVVPPGETAPALDALTLQQTVQKEIVAGVRSGTRGGLGHAAKLGTNSWCTWDLKVRVRRK